MLWFVLPTVGSAASACEERDLQLDRSLIFMHIFSADTHTERTVIGAVLHLSASSHASGRMSEGADSLQTLCRVNF